MAQASPERTSYENTALYASLAVESAATKLDAEGNIDYTRFEHEALHALQTGPGFVTDPAQVDPIHIDAPTTLEFARRSNNFHTYFDPFWGATGRKTPYYDRFKILFPDVESTLCAYHEKYMDAWLADLEHFPIDETLFEALRFVYGVMSQLVDLNDHYYDGKTVHEIDTYNMFKG